MKRFIKFPDIEQFRNIVRNVQHAAQYVRRDEKTGKPIMDLLAPIPIVKAVATEKIHGCFEKSTMVTLSNGEQVPISKLEIGTYILSFNTVTGVDEYKKVTGVINQQLNKEWCKLVFDSTTIVCTKDHKFWTENRGYVEAQYLTSEDIFKTV